MVHKASEKPARDGNFADGRPKVRAGGPPSTSGVSSSEAFREKSDAADRSRFSETLVYDLGAFRRRIRTGFGPATVEDVFEDRFFDGHMKRRRTGGIVPSV